MARTTLRMRLAGQVRDGGKAGGLREGRRHMRRRREKNLIRDRGNERSRGRRIREGGGIFKEWRKDQKLGKEERREAGKQMMQARQEGKGGRGRRKGVRHAEKREEKR